MTRISHSKLKNFFKIIIISTLFLHCDNEKEFYFPYVEVDVRLHVYTDLADMGNNTSKFYSGEYSGLGGILIYRLSQWEFLAFDLACTYEISPDCVIEKYKGVDIFFKCPCCSSEYTIDANSINGNFVSKEPARFPLKQYNAYVDNDYLYITNSL